MENQKNLEPENHSESIMPMVWFGIIYGLISSLVLFIILRMRGEFKTNTIGIGRKINKIENPKIKLEIVTIEENDQEIQYDDLTSIKGIGPVISKVLNNNGITSFSDLAECSNEEILKILIANRIRLSNYESWPVQAKFAENGNWEDLEKYQMSL